MAPKSEGIRRLCIVAGALAALCWVIFVWYKGTRPIYRWGGVVHPSVGIDDLLVALLGMPVAYVVTTLIIRAVCWVYYGFKEHQHTDKPSSE